jgi:hypothetical protein
MPTTLGRLAICTLVVVGGAAVLMERAEIRAGHVNIAAIVNGRTNLADMRGHLCWGTAHQVRIGAGNCFESLFTTPFFRLGNGLSVARIALSPLVFCDPPERSESLV